MAKYSTREHAKLLDYLESKSHLLTAVTDASLSPTDLDRLIDSAGNVDRALDFLRFFDSESMTFDTFDDLLGSVSQAEDNADTLTTYAQATHTERKHDEVPLKMDFALAVKSNIDDGTTTQLLNKLRESSGIYHDFTAEDMASIAVLVSAVQFESGDQIIKYGEQASFAMFVLDGSLGYTRRGKNEPTIPLNTGAVFGAPGYFEDIVRGGDVVAAKSSIVALLSFQLLHRLAELMPFKAELAGKLVRLLAGIALREKDHHYTTDGQHVDAPAKEEQMAQIRMMVANEFLYKKLESVPPAELLRKSSKDPLNDALAQDETERLRLENQQLQRALSEKTTKVSEYEGIIIELRSSIEEMEEVDRKRQLAITQEITEVEAVFKEELPEEGDLQDKIAALPADVREHIHSLEEKHLQTSDHFRHLLNEQKTNRAEIAELKSELQTVHKNMRTMELSYIHSDERQKHELLETRKSMHSYAVLLKFISVQQFVKSWRTRNQLRSLFQKICQTNSNVMTQVFLSRDNSVDQTEMLHKLKTRTKRKMRDYPWNKHQQVPIKWLINHLEREVIDCDTNAEELKTEKLRWQKTSKSFFDRNSELKNELLESQELQEKDQHALSDLREEYKKLEEQNQLLQYQLETAEDSAANQSNQAAEEQARAAVQVRSARMEKNILFAETIDLRRRITQLKQYLVSLTNSKAKLEKQIDQLDTTRVEMLHERDERNTRSQNSNIIFAYGIAEAMDNNEERSPRNAPATTVEKLPRFQTEGGGMKESDASTGKRIRAKPPSARRKQKNEKNITGVWRSARKKNSKGQNVVDVTLPRVQPLFKVQYQP